MNNLNLILSILVFAICTINLILNIIVFYKINKHFKTTTKANEVLSHFK